MLHREWILVCLRGDRDVVGEIRASGSKRRRAAPFRERQRSVLRRSGGGLSLCGRTAASLDVVGNLSRGESFWGAVHFHDSGIRSGHFSFGRDRFGAAAGNGGRGRVV